MRITLLSPYQRPGMHAMITLKAHEKERVPQSLDFFDDIFALVVENHAEKAEWRRGILF